MTERKRKLLFWFFKIAGIVVSCALPIWAICEKFPIWVVEHGTGHSVGMGAILIIIVLIIIFRRTVFDFIKERFDLRHAPPLTVWLIMLAISYILVYIGEVMRDMTTVLWMGFIGSCIGTFLTYISERFNKKEVTSNERT
jgi:hypothetical protein